MDGSGVVRRRLARQFLSRLVPRGAEEVVRWFGAVQAQDFLASLWALGVRIPGATEADIERSIDEGRILRTWPMRGTIHYVPAEDARWMLDLLTPRVVSGMAGRHRRLGLDEKTFERSEEIIHEALRGGKAVARKELMGILDSEGVETSGQRGYHVLWYLAQRGFICFGPRERKQPTVVLLDEWAPEQRKLDRDEALAELAGRYFQSHGPATLHDFAWWTGLTIADCRAAMDGVSPHLEEWKDGDRTLFHMPNADEPEGEPETVMLLPFVDEYMVGYKDRRDFLKQEYTERTFHGLMSVVVSDGEIIGMWKRKLASKKVIVELDLFEPLGRAEKDALAEAARRYGAFLGKPVEVSG